MGDESEAPLAASAAAASRFRWASCCACSACSRFGRSASCFCRASRSCLLSLASVARQLRVSAEPLAGPSRPSRLSAAQPRPAYVWPLLLSPASVARQLRVSAEPLAGPSRPSRLSAAQPRPAYVWPLLLLLLLLLGVVPLHTFVERVQIASCLVQHVMRVDPFDSCRVEAAYGQDAGDEKERSDTHTVLPDPRFGSSILGPKECPVEQLAEAMTDPSQSRPNRAGAERTAPCVETASSTLRLAATPCKRT